MIFSGCRSCPACRSDCPINGSQDIFRKSRKVGLTLTLASLRQAESLQLGRVPLAKCPQFSLRTQNRVRNHVPLHRHGQNFRSPRLSPRRLFYRGGVAARSRKKTSFLGGKGRFCDFDIFSKKKPVGSSFHVYVMKVHARTRWVNVPDLEKMLHKVRWALGEVSL